MANNGIATLYDDNGLPIQAARTMPVTAGANSGLQQVKIGAGRLLKAAVTTAIASAAVTFYDNGAGAASGTVLAVIPAGTAAGAPIDVNLPAVNGIVMGSAGATGNVTVAYA